MSIAPVTPPRTARVKMDSILAGAVDLARAAAIEDADQPNHVGAHLGSYMVGERLAAHTFACEMRGYVGWEWTVTVARIPRGRVATVCEVHLLPTQEAILAPAWLPWAERLKPGDIGPGDVMPFKADDARLVEGYKPTGDEQEDQVAIEELALARTRILSETGRDEAAQRWYDGLQGPRSQGSLQSAANCGSCGFLVPLQGALGQVFGVCANLWSDDDGKVVALGHGCGAHSETDVPHRSTDWPENNPIIDETAIEPVSAEQLAAIPDLESEEFKVQSTSSELAQDSASEQDNGAVATAEQVDSATELPGARKSQRVRGAAKSSRNQALEADLSKENSAESTGSQTQDETVELGAIAHSDQNSPESLTANDRSGGKARKGKKKSDKTTAKGAQKQGKKADQKAGDTRIERPSDDDSLVLDLPEIKEREPQLTREEALLNLNAIADSLPQRGGK